MPSIRRTLSPVPRPGSLMNGEACSVSSPLSKSSSSPQNYPPSRSLLSFLFSNPLESPRFLRPYENSKPKGQAWKRAIFHFLICFLVGIFIGLAHFSSTNLLSTNNLLSNHQAYFETTSMAGKIQSLDNNITSHIIPLRREEEEGVAPLYHDNNPVRRELNLESGEKLLIIVTATFSSPLQAYELNRLEHVLKLVPPPLLWIVVETGSQSMETADILRRSGIMYRHLVCSKNLSDVRDVRVHQRNIALLHIETHQLDGIIYFAEENDVYSIDLFQNMRQIRRFGTWVVAKLSGYNTRAVLEGPVCNESQIIGWQVNDPPHVRFRRFHAQMAGFAFNSTVLWDPKRWHRPTLEPIRQLDTVKDGFQVSNFIEQIVEDESQMEGLPQDCSTVMVWNLHLESPHAFYPHSWFLMNNLDTISSLAGR